MNLRSKVVINQQMKILFRGEDSSVLNRRISYEDERRLLYLNIEFIKSYLPNLNGMERKRAMNTLRILEEQKNATLHSKQFH